MKTTFTVFFNNWSKTAICNHNGKNCIPADMWADWQKGMSIDGWSIESSVMWQTIQPKTPARGKNPHNFTFTIEGNGIEKNILSKNQEGIFSTRFPTEDERLFREWFTYLCNEKFNITSKF